MLATGDHLLRSGWADDLRPDVVVQLGAMPTSKGYRLWLDRVGVGRLVAVDHLGRFPDTALLVTDRVAAEPGRVATHLVDRLADLAAGDDGTSDWTRTWITAEVTATSAVADVVAAAPFDEPGVVAALDGALPDAATLVVGNSMPLRLSLIHI